jgi:hypothetical protein
MYTRMIVLGLIGVAIWNNVPALRGAVGSMLEGSTTTGSLLSSAGIDVSEVMEGSPLEALPLPPSQATTSADALPQTTVSPVVDADALAINTEPAPIAAEEGAQAVDRAATQAEREEAQLRALLEQVRELRSQ